LIIVSTVRAVLAGAHFRWRMLVPAVLGWLTFLVYSSLLLSTTNESDDPLGAALPAFPLGITADALCGALLLRWLGYRVLPRKAAIKEMPAAPATTAAE
jgi:hypothetical protein